MYELGGFAENPEVLDGNQRDYEAYNFCLAEEYLYAMISEEWEKIGTLSLDLIDNIVYWLNYDGKIGNDIKETIEKIPHGLITTCNKRTFVDAIIEEHKAHLAETFIMSGNHDVRLYLTAIIYNEDNFSENILLNYIHNSSKHNTSEKYAEFLKEIFQGIEQYYTNINDSKEQSNFLLKIKPFIKSVRFPIEYKENPKLIEVDKLQSFSWQKDLKKLLKKTNTNNTTSEYNSDVLGYDCDGNELYEFDVVRAIFYSDINFEEEHNIDPRHYCVVKGFDGKGYLVSIYDHWNRSAINRYEGRVLDANVPLKIRTISEAINYEKAYNFTKKDFNKTELTKVLNKKLKKTQR